MFYVNRTILSVIDNTNLITNLGYNNNLSFCKDIKLSIS